MCAVAVLSETSRAALQAGLPEFKSKQALQARATSRQVNKEDASESIFYTGKPFEANREGYLFKYRNYSAGLNRWTSIDPSGFPDGINNNAYLPTPTYELDWQGLLTVDPNSGTPGHWVHGDLKLDMAGVWYTATTTKGNSFSVFKYSYIASNSTGLPESEMDLTANCHGYVFLPGYWIDNSNVNTILNDEWTPTDEAHALIVEYSGNEHTVNNPLHDLNGNIYEVTGKDGYMPVVHTPLDGTGYSSPSFWE